MLKLSITIFVLALGLYACKSTDSGTHMPTLPTTEITIPPTTEAPTTTLPASCPQAGPGTYKCYNWGPCQGLFANRDAAIAILRQNDPSGCHQLDAEVLPDGGFGPCAQCQSFQTGAKALSIIPSYEEILKARAQLLMQKHK